MSRSFSPYLDIDDSPPPLLATPPEPLDNRFCHNSLSEEVRSILTPFGLTDVSGLLNVMYRTGAVIAGGAATNYIYNQLHPAHARPIHPDSDLDFWIADPTPPNSHSRRVYRTLIMNLWEQFLTAAGYVSYCPESQEEYEESDTERNTFQVECGATLTVHYYGRESAAVYNRIQVIFYSGPASAAELVRNFDLSVSRCMIYVSGVNHLWVGHTFAEEDLRAERITLRLPPTARTFQRIQRYVERYGFSYGAGVGITSSG